VDLNLDPNLKRWLVIGAAVLGIVVLAYLSMMFQPSEMLSQGAKREKIRNLLTSSDPRSLTLDALASRVSELESSQRAILGEIQALRKADEDRFKAFTASQREQYERKIEELSKKLEEKETGEPKTIELPPSPSPSSPSAGPQPSVGYRTPQIRPWSPDGVIEPQVPPPAAQKASEQQKPAVVIRTVSVEKAEVAKTTQPEKQDVVLASLPAGSILSGVLLNGMDAPTSQRARQDPQPVLVRIKHEAILPNLYRSDIRECFLIAAGYGDMSSERAYLRSETLACVRNDRKVIESKVNSYAVGEDGKVGVRGRLVSKQGRVLANAMLAGFAKGIAQIFGRQQVPVIVTSPQGTAPFQSMLSADAAQAAAVRGAGEAMETLARFYLDMAENLFPVIEVDAGRKVEFILNQGLKLTTAGTVEG
jgi:conjugal transfer pilus assembly protein TraB